MVIVSVNPRRAQEGGSIDVSDFADVPGCTQVRWAADGGTLEVVFSRDLSAAEQTIVINRCESLNAVDEELRRRALTALDTNRTFLAIPQPTAAQAIAQTQALTRQNVGIIRMLLQDLDGTD